MGFPVSSFCQPRIYPRNVIVEHVDVIKQTVTDHSFPRHIVELIAKVTFKNIICYSFGV
jgi:hypothetical protein